MADVIDARGLACPQPVILTNKRLTLEDSVITVVDNDAARENLMRLGRSRDCDVRVDVRDDGVYVHFERSGSSPEKNREEQAIDQTEFVCNPSAGPTVLLVSSDVIGRGDDTLGQILMRAFFHTLGEVEPLPQKLIFLNGGVRLVVEGAETLEDIQALESKGIDVAVCGTCLGHYDLTKSLAAGHVSNMYDIAQALLEAGKIVEF